MTEAFEVSGSLKVILTTKPKPSSTPDRVASIPHTNDLTEKNPTSGDKIIFISVSTVPVHSMSDISFKNYETQKKEEENTPLSRDKRVNRTKTKDDLCFGTVRQDL